MPSSCARFSIRQHRSDRVEAGFGVSVVPRSVNRINGPAVTYLPIVGDMPRAPIALAYRRDDRSAAVQHFVTLARLGMREISR